MDNFEGIDEKLKAKKDSNKEDRVTYSLDAPGTIDVLVVEEKLVYLTEGLNLVDTIRVEDKVFAPPPKSSIPYFIADADKVFHYLAEYKANLRHSLDLYEELLTYHKNISDLPHEAYYDLLALWDFHTYLLDKLHFSPIIYLYAVKERGKSRTGKGCIYVSRRGVWTETVREADIIRWGNDHKAALGFDVKDAPKKFQRANCDDLILARFEEGSSSSRTLWPEKGAFRDTKTFNLFGPTIIATNRPVDDILESRAISVDMKPTGKVFNNPVTPKDAWELKARLTAFRILHYQDELKEVDKPASGRLGDIAGSLYKIVTTYFPEKEASFARLLNIISERKKEDATDSLEAKVLEMVIDLNYEVEKGFLSIEAVTKKINTGKEERFTLAEDVIGRILRGLGFVKKRTAGKRGIFYDLDLIEKLKLNYGLDTSNDTSDTETDIPNKDSDPSEDSGISEAESHESQVSPSKLTQTELSYTEEVEA
ncbi:hypothetical protein HYS91_05155 [Candidatus Daviesbacteria bacterium]|nr:hypothetical protein [Candidatus Daviesbacteria bacterium]